LLSFPQICENAEAEIAPGLDGVSDNALSRPWRIERSEVGLGIRTGQQAKKCARL
jgi:hypothetical protein